MSDDDPNSLPSEHPQADGDARSAARADSRSFADDRDALFARLLILNGLADEHTIETASGKVNDSIRLPEVLVATGAITDDERQAIELLLEKRLVAGNDDPQPGSDTQATATHSCADPSIADTVTFGAAQRERQRVSKSFGNYEILETIAEGGMGVVYKARQTKLNRLVALKMIRSGELADEQAVRRFRTEAQAAAKLDHPGIVPVYEVGEFSGQQFYSMAFIEGASLAETVKDAGPLSPKHAAKLVCAVADAVQFGHDKGIVHRDIKPQNVLLTESGVPRVTDFGLAKHGDSEITVAGQVMGTPSYMPPEQARGKQDAIGAVSDVYSLGATLYYLLTARAPFQAATPAETLRQVIDSEPVPPGRLNSAIPRDLETICLKCLHKEAEKRYASAADLAADLQRWISGETITARPVGNVERSWRWMRRHPAQTALLAVSALAALSLVGVVVGRSYRGRLETANASLTTSNAKLETALGTAKSATEAAVRARDGEQKAKQKLDRVLYIRRLSLAIAEWKENRAARARELLAACPQQYRGWEWHYAYRMCHPEWMTLKGHTDEVYCVAISPDGKRIASGSRDGSVRIWDAETGEELLKLNGHRWYVERVVFSPDSKRIASCAVDVVVWDAQTGKRLLKLEAHTQHVRCVAFSPDGQRIASGSVDNTAKVWDTDSGTQLLTLQHDDTVNSVAFAPDGETIATACYDGRTRLWDAQTGSLTQVFRQGRHGFHVAFSRDGKWIASSALGGDMKGRCTVWDAQSRTELLSVPAISKPTFSPDGTRIAGTDGSTAKEWDRVTGKELRVLAGHLDRVTEVAYSSDGRRIASSSTDGTVKVWNLRAVREPRAIELPLTHFDAAFSPDGRQVAGGDRQQPGALVVGSLYGTSGLRRLTVSGRYEQALCVAFSPDARRVAAGDSEGNVTVFDVVTGESKTWQGHNDDVACVAFSPDGRRLATGGIDETLRVWDASSGNKQLELEGHGGWVQSISFSPDGQRIASGSADGTAKIWNATTGTEEMSLAGHQFGCSCVAFSPDGDRIVSGSETSKWQGYPTSNVKVWNLKEGGPPMTLGSHAGVVASVAFSPDGTRIASAGGATVKVWDAASDDELLTLHLDAAPTKVAFGPAGKTILAATYEGSVTIWDARSGQWADDPPTIRVPPQLLLVDEQPDPETRESTSPVENPREDTETPSPSIAQRTDKSEDKTEQLEQLLYMHRVNRAIYEWKDNEAQRARKLLAACRTEDRGWEWHYVNRMCHPELMTLTGHRDKVLTVALSPDGQQIASGGWDRAVKIWDAQSGAPLRTLNGHRWYVRSVVYSPDGKKIASSASNIILWDAQTGKMLLTIKGHTKHIWSIAFSADGKRIVSGSSDRSVRVWDAVTGEEQMKLTGHRSLVQSVAISPDGKWIASCDNSGRLILWNAVTGEKTRDTRLGGVAPRLAFSPDGKLLASTGNGKQQLKLRDVQSWQETLTIPSWVGRFAFSADGKQIAGSSASNTIRVWDAATAKELRSFAGHTDLVSAITFSRDGRRLVTGSYDKSVKVWDVAAPPEPHTLTTPLASNSVAFSPDGRHVAGGHRFPRGRGNVDVIPLDPEGDEQMLQLEGHNTSYVRCAAYSRDGKFIAAGYADGVVTVFDTATGAATNMSGHTSAVQSLAFSPDGKRLASAAQDKTILLCNAETGQQEQTLQGHEKLVTSVAFSPDGKWIGSGSDDETIRVWSAETGQPRMTLSGSDAGISCVAFSPDATRIAGGSSTGIDIWDLAQKRKTLGLEGHARGVASLAFSPAGNRIASSSADGTVKLWQAASGIELLTLRRDVSLHSVSFGPAGKTIAAAGADGSVTIWDARSDQWPDDRATK